MIRSAPFALVVLALLTGCVAAPESVEEPAPSASAPTSDVSCESVEPDVVDTGGATWQHPRNSFYDGSEEDIPTEADLEHLLRSDNAIVVIYDRQNLPDAAISPLQDWITYETAAVAIPSTDEPRAPIEVRLPGSRVSLCDGVDIIQLDALSESRTFGEVEEHGDEGEAGESQ